MQTDSQHELGQARQLPPATTAPLVVGESRMVGRLQRAAGSSAPGGQEAVRPVQATGELPEQAPGWRTGRPLVGAPSMPVALGIVHLGTVATGRAADPVIRIFLQGQRGRRDAGSAIDAEHRLGRSRQSWC
jgi:hypothetical protein